jgi:EmrB/QacA subfamily drug resistance transporter
VTAVPADAQSADTQAADAQGHEARWAGLGVVLIGTLIVSLDSTMVGVALPSIGRALGAGADVQWVLTANLLAVAVSMPAAGWVAHRVGAKQVFLTALAVFSVASLVAAVAPTLPVLVAARVLQGLCAGVLNPLSMTIVLDLFPPAERGRAMGVWGLTAMSAPALGPTLGGYLVTAVNWHLLFLINVPIGLVGALAGRRLLVDTGVRDRRRLDGMGLVLGASGLALFLFTLSQARRWGWGAPATLGCLGAALLLLATFTRHALRHREPLLQLRLARMPVYSVSLVIIALVTVPQYARSVFVPLQLQEMRGDTALQVGVLLTPSAIATAISMAIGGRAVDRIGARIPAVVGCALMLVGTVANSFNSVDTSAAWIAGWLTVQGLGVGMVMIPVTVAGLNALPEDTMAQASTLRSLTNQVSAAMTVAVLFALVNARLSDATTPAASQGAYNVTFQVAAVALAVAVVLAWRIGRRAR